jgi:radical SAM superfamily enzyme YgiQ (UPF0313 family)
MKILMMRPRPSKDTIGLQHLMIVEPLELEVLAGSVNEDIIIVDMILEKQKVEYFIEKHKPRVFCVTGYISHVQIMLDYCKAVKNFDSTIITVAGGIHLEVKSEIFDSPWIDFRVVRNATSIFPTLIDSIKKSIITNGNSFDSQLIKTPPGILKQGESIKELPPFDFYFPIPRRDLVKKYQKKYFYLVYDKVALLKTSFGCPYTCNFCFCRKITGGKYIERNLEEVIQELEGLWQKSIYIIDDNFLVSEKRVRAFIQALKTKNIQKQYLIYGRVDFIAEHESLIEEFTEMGLKGIIVGIESFDEQELKHYNKNQTRDSIDKALHIMNRLKLDILATMIVSPDWEEADFKKLQQRLRKFNIKFANIQPLTPLPGIDLHINPDQIIIDPNDFDKWDLAHVMIKPEKLSVKRFYQYLLQSYLKTILRPKQIINQLRYPLKTQCRMFLGVFRVYRQYKWRIKNA